MGRLFAERGYQVLIQSCRGTFGSAGDWVPLRNEQADGHATLGWIAAQPWFDGKLVTFGPSYLGLTQWSVAEDPPDFLRAMSLNVTSSNFRDAVVYPGRSFALETGLTWLYQVEHQELGYRRVLKTMLTSGRAVKSEPAAGQEAERHHQGADHRVNRENGVVHADGVLGEPVNRRDQQRVATLVQRRTGEVDARPARQDPRRDQVRGLVGVGQGRDLPAAEPHPQPGLDQPAEPEQQAPPPRRSPRGAGQRGAGRRGAARRGPGLCRVGGRGPGHEGGDVSRISDGGRDQRAAQGGHSLLSKNDSALGPERDVGRRCRFCAHAAGVRVNSVVVQSENELGGFCVQGKNSLVSACMTACLLRLLRGGSRRHSGLCRYLAPRPRRFAAAGPQLSRREATRTV